MAALTVWVLAEDQADLALDTLYTIVEHDWVDALDAAVVRWPATDANPSTEVLTDLPRRHPFDPALWGLLFALTFFSEALGVGMSAAADVLSQSMGALGITPELGERLRAEIVPGTAALFLYSGGELAERGEHAEQIREVLKGIPITLIRSNLDDEQEARLRAVFGRPRPTSTGGGT